MHKLDPTLVAERLAEAGRLFRPRRVDELRWPVPAHDLSPRVVQARLEAFSALMKLADYLGKARVDSPPDCPTS